MQGWAGAIRALSALIIGLGAGAVSANASTSDDATSVATAQSLRDLSIEQLGQLQVTSVEKRPVAVSDAPAAIYVITHDDIVRSGAISLPEILRLAPNLQVYQTSASSFVVTARGFSGNGGDQSFSNLMLVQIDGRSVYNPIFTGVYWDMQDVVPEDIDRIEVISGPAGALWGANAVNGVINIITRKAGETTGGYIDYTNGTLGRSLTLQYGVRVNDSLALRAYVRDLTYYDTVTASGAKAADEWSKPQGGLRLDWTPTPADSVSLHGDYFQGWEATGGPDEYISDRNVVGRWDHAWSGGGDFDVLAYWDRAERAGQDGGGAFFVDTYDIEAQDSFHVGAHNQVVAGAGFRLDRYGIDEGTSGLLFSPARARLDISNIFVQDTWALTPRLSATAGLKLENDPDSGVSPMPSLRVAWKPADGALLWAAVSRAVRSPAPFDTDVNEVVGGHTLLFGNANFLPETLIAYEVGTRLQPTSRWSFSLSLFDNVYDDLRNVQVAPNGFFPLTWGNGIDGYTWGFDAWADYRVTNWWRLTASFDLLRERLRFTPAASDSAFIGIDQDGNDPRHTASIRSSMDLGHRVSFDADLRYVDALPAPSVPAYVEMDSRLAWRLTRRVEISVAGFNLLHAHHLEQPVPANAVPRSVQAELRVGF